MVQAGEPADMKSSSEEAGEETWPSLTPFAFGRAQDSGNGKNPVPSPSCLTIQKHSPVGGTTQCNKKVCGSRTCKLNLPEQVAAT
jgi:hypothetical protein